MRRKIDFNILESLRGMAALYVCIAHCRGVLWIGGEHYLKLHPRDTWGIYDYLLLGFNMLTRLSTEFVIVFFVLSGFSISHSLRKSKEALPFYKRRFIRLYPPYVAAILWAMLVFLLISALSSTFVDGTYDTLAFNRMKDSNELFSLSVFIKNLFYVPHLGGFLQPFWSLTMEVIFYLLAPFLFRNKNIYHLFSITLFLLAMAAKTFHWPVQTILLNFGYYNIFFSIGVALYDHYDLVLKKAEILTRKYYAPLACLGLFFAMIAISLLGWNVLNAFLSAGMSCILIIYLLSNNRQIGWLFNVGKYSYTLYITHFPTIFLYMCLYFLVTKNPMPYIFNPLVFIPCIFVCLGVAYLQYLLVERKSKKILDGLRKKSPVEAPTQYESAGVTQSN